MIVQRKKAATGISPTEEELYVDPPDVEISSDKGYFEKKRPSLANTFLKQAACYEYKDDINKRASINFNSSQLQQSQESLNSSVAISRKSSLRSQRLSKLQKSEKLANKPPRQSSAIKYDLYSSDQKQQDIVYIEAMNNFSPFNLELPEQQFQLYSESKEDSKEFEFLVEIDDNQSVVRNEEIVGQYLP